MLHLVLLNQMQMSLQNRGEKGWFFCTEVRSLLSKLLKLFLVEVVAMQKQPPELFC